jgi:erythromycin esterase
MSYESLSCRRSTVTLTLTIVTCMAGTLGACAGKLLPEAPARNEPTPEKPGHVAPGVAGAVAFDDNAPGAMACITLTELSSGAQRTVVVADRDGRFSAPIAPGEYAIAVTSEHGFAWIDKQTISSSVPPITLTRNCSPVAGRVATARSGGTQVRFGRWSFDTGDTFITHVRDDGTFGLCLPAGRYSTTLSGGELSLYVDVEVPARDPIVLHGYAASEIRRPPGVAGVVAHDIDGLVADVVHSGARLVGMGEATHGGAEFVTMRAKLTFELARRGQLQLVLFENDAIAVMGLERYVNGEDVDLAAQVAALGFWTTDTHEFLHFLEDVRRYNLGSSSASARIHIWGIDVQNTKLPVELLTANAQTLRLTGEEHELLQAVAPDRGKAVKLFSVERRAALDALLSRLSAPVGSADLHTQLAVAARSLATQVGYTDGDTVGLYAVRRDAGMAQLASFIVDRTGAKRAALWAHDGHITRASDGRDSMGKRLSSALSSGYYPIGFFLFEGSSRAWDSAGKIGVISHSVPPAPPFSIEGALMSAAGSPGVAWLPLRRLPAPLRAWLAIPRFAREMGAVYNGEERTMLLLEPSVAFDALVVIKTVHDSSPTPTGIRQVTR